LYHNPQAPEAEDLGPEFWAKAVLEGDIAVGTAELDAGL
jgi:hypothetical protein